MEHKHTIAKTEQPLTDESKIAVGKISRQNISFVG